MDLPHRLPMIFILLTILLDGIGIGLILPVMPDLVREVEGGTLAEAAIWGGIMSTLFAVMQFLFGPTVGSLSDRFGRRPVLLVSLGIMALDYLVMALAGTIWLLLLGRIVGGIAAATHSTAQAFVADMTPRAERGARFGHLTAAFGIGFVLGPLMGGILGDMGTRAPFYAAAALAAANFVLGLLVLPETVTDKTRRAFDWRRANPLGAFAAVARLPGLRALIVVLFLNQLAFNVYPVIWAYFTQARFGWDSSMIGLSLAVYGLSLALVLGGLIRPVMARLGERGTILLGFGFALMSFTVMAFVTSGWVALALTPVASLGWLATPAIQGLLSRRSPDDAQGELQGLITSVNALALILAPLVMTRVFFAFTREGAGLYMPGAPFLASLLLCLLAMGLFLGGRHRYDA